MSGMDRLTVNDLEYWEEYGDYDVKLMARELLAHRRASQVAPAPSDGLREALADALDLLKSFVLNDSVAYRNGIAALTPAPAQEGGE